MKRLSLILILPALFVTLLPAVAEGAKAKKSVSPKVTKVSPMRASVGSTLVIRGSKFKSRARRNTVIFAVGRRSIFVKPSSGSRGRLVVRLPKALERLMRLDKDGFRLPTRFTIQVASGRFSKRTRRRLSPVIVPSKGAGRPPKLPAGVGGTSPAPVVPAPPPDCDGDGILDSADTSSDGDLMDDSFERNVVGTDPCKTDTDADGIEDGFEYRSAVDLNNDEYQDPNQSLPYPGQRPYPNALDPTDGNTDYDGDALSGRVEQDLWKLSTVPASRSLSSLTYSDGLQYSIYEFRPGEGDRRFPDLPAAGYSKHTDFVTWAGGAGYRNVFVNVHHPDKAAGVYGIFDSNLSASETAAEEFHFDTDGDGFLSDDERDEDADGLANVEEVSHYMRPGFWENCYTEALYYIAYAGVNPADPDSDNDGVRDGADDQDHDDVPNVMELSRIAASSGLNDTEAGRECKLSQALEEVFAEQEPPIYWHAASYGRVNPFNPCLPDANSRTCKRIVDFGTAWAPFDNSIDWLSLN